LQNEIYCKIWRFVTSFSYKKNQNLLLLLLFFRWFMMCWKGLNNGGKLIFQGAPFSISIDSWNFNAHNVWFSYENHSKFVLQQSNMQWNSQFSDTLRRHQYLHNSLQNNQISFYLYCFMSLFARFTFISNFRPHHFDYDCKWKTILKTSDSVKKKIVNFIVVLSWCLQYLVKL
jgi:hypothetical protein